MPPAQKSKAALRDVAAALRAQAHAAASPFAVENQTQNILAILETKLGAQTQGPVCGYWPIRTEADSRPALEALASQGTQTGLPAVQGQELVFRLWRPGEPTAPGAYGIPEPLAQSPPVRPAALIVPLLTFDYAGHRLGYGGGFYDRALRALRAQGPILAIGLAFEAQKTDLLPAEPGDEALDVVVTELRIREFRMGRV